ncbi:MAG: XdhC family protein [Bacteroidetes bacterium]|nr:XdhC family protein [Bacteroidota bacterium]
MKEIEVWKFIDDSLEKNIAVGLMLVTESAGSSPGRQGFKMAINRKGEMQGSIGGGIMEHKLVEMMKSSLAKTKVSTQLKKQVHRKDEPLNQSGMICSGEQTVLLLPVSFKDHDCIKEIIQYLVNKETASLTIDPQGLSLKPNIHNPQPFNYNQESETDWIYQENLGYKYKLFIVGGGHVSLALSELLKSLDFYITVIDDRPQLNTLENNTFADQKIYCKYEEVEQHLPPGKENFVLLMTYGYRDDNMVLRKIIHRDYGYLGMMGSKEKVRQIFEGMDHDGFDPQLKERVHAPIGIQIKSKTPQEIAVSIAAEIVEVKNSV